MKEYHGFNSEQEYEEYAQLMWLINNNKEQDCRYEFHAR
jgi:hypothetical protein